MTATSGADYRQEAAPAPADAPGGRPKGTARAVLRRSRAGFRNKT
jgi:hypothetical protein